MFLLRGRYQLIIPYMKRAKNAETWFFVDESGDPTYYDRKGNYIVGNDGCSPILLLGFIETQHPRQIRKAILDLKNEIVDDPYFQDFPSLSKTARAFHAKDDRPEVRYRVFKLLAELDFSAQFVVARKVEHVFVNRFRRKEANFYNYLVSCLFEQVLHRYQINNIYISKRGSKDRQRPLANAVQLGLSRFENKTQQKVETKRLVRIQVPSDEPCLSVVDYMNWAVYRAFVKGEMNYFNVVRNKISWLVDLYDDASRPHNRYNRKKPFDINKITPL